MRFLLKKELTVTDVGELGRIVLPKVRILSTFCLMMERERGCTCTLGTWNGAICMTSGAHHVVLLGPFPFCRETRKVSFLTWIARRGNCSHWRTTTLTRTGVFDTSKSILLI